MGTPVASLMDRNDAGHGRVTRQSTEYCGGTVTRKLTEAEIEESLEFGQGALAAAGHFVTDPEIIEGSLAVLRGEMTEEEYDELAYRQATGQ